MALDRDEFITHVQLIREDIAGVHERLDALNGRTRTNETDIAVLKDRQSDARKSGSTWGAGGGFLGGLLAGFLQHWMTGAK